MGCDYDAVLTPAPRGVQSVSLAVQYHSIILRQSDESISGALRVIGPQRRRSHDRSRRSRKKIAGSFQSQDDLMSGEIFCKNPLRIQGVYSCPTEWERIAVVRLRDVVRSKNVYSGLCGSPSANERTF